MREIKFRGKRVDNGKWIEGDLLRMNGHTFIFPDPALKGIDKYAVDPSTVGQLTGLKDKNGEEIFEGDILRVVTDFGEVFNRDVYYLNSSFCIHLGDETDILSIAYAVEANSAEVIGNIHDNPTIINPEE